MSQTRRSAFVNLVRKSLGLPTGQSSCCGAARTAADESTKATADTCCASESTKVDTQPCCPNEPASPQETTGCCS